MDDDEPLDFGEPIPVEINACPEFVPMPYDHQHCERCGWDVRRHPRWP